jgi:hypothetical protein
VELIKGLANSQIDLNWRWKESCLEAVSKRRGCGILPQQILENWGWKPQPLSQHQF